MTCSPQTSSHSWNEHWRRPVLPYGITRSQGVEIKFPDRLWLNAISVQMALSTAISLKSYGSETYLWQGYTFLSFESIWIFTYRRLVGDTSTWIPKIAWHHNRSYKPIRKPTLPTIIDVLSIHSWTMCENDWPVAQIPSYTSPISHNVPFGYRNAHFGYKTVHCGIYV